MTSAEKEKSFECMVEAMNKSDVEVFVIQDYWTFDGYHAFRDFLKNRADGFCSKKVLPGIELRVQSPTNYRLNVHGVFSEELTRQQLEDFKAKLRLVRSERSLSDEAIRQFARGYMDDAIRKEHGAQDWDLSIDEKAFELGAKCVEITAESFRSAFVETPESSAVIMMPWDTYGGLEDLKWAKHYAASRDYFSRPHIFETRKQDYRDAFSGIRTSGNGVYFDGFKSALNGKPRLAISGSDAHKYEDYGKFVGGKPTWIKADTCFRGLLQATREPASRSYLGEEPPKLTALREKPTHYLKSISFIRSGTPISADTWFGSISLDLNPDLIAIIGNKGSGKSALADVLALIGDTGAFKHFSFLNRRRFREEKKSWSKDFEVAGAWVSGEVRTVPLAKDPESYAVERIKYVPQSYFEEICNEYVIGKTNTFEKELKSVIFSHIDEGERSNFSSLDDLLQNRESQLEKSIIQMRAELSRLNASIYEEETRLNPENRERLQNTLVLKEQELAAHDLNKPGEVSKPSDENSPEMQEKLDRLASLKKDISACELALAGFREERKRKIAERSSIDKVKEGIAQLERLIASAKVELEIELETFGIGWDQIFKLEVSSEVIDTKRLEIEDQIQVLHNQLDPSNSDGMAAKLNSLENSAKELSIQLDEPNRLYQEYLIKFQSWNEARVALIGSSSLSGSIEFVRAEIEQLKILPERLQALREERTLKSREIYSLIIKKKVLRESLFSPVQRLIDSHVLIREEFKLQFRSYISMMGFSEKFFGYVKHSAGTFRGEEEGQEELRKIMESHDIESEEGIVAFINDIMNSVMFDKRSDGAPEISIDKVIRSSSNPASFYDFIFGLDYIDPKYSLLLADTPIEKLSPGQRGALLLIFYLLVDKDPCPIVLDQPEENLDNQTVFSLLVPIIKEAKNRRQVIMVTHNANLAVTCDAEQVIHASFVRSDGNKISYVSGAIENPSINKLVIDVLEGTRPAFENRSEKYLETA
jgi:ABC-type lipoprotein export system ATPase subunit